MIIEQKWNFLFLALLIVVAVVVSMVYKSHNPVCPDDFKDPKKEIASFSKWAEEFYQNNPNATTKEMSKARVNFWRDNNCTEALKRYDDYMAGNVDEETKQLIEMVTKEATIRNQVKPICPQDFKDPSEKLASFFEWEKEFRKDNPKADILDLAKARKSFYIEHNCNGATQRPESYKAGQIDEKAQQLIDIIENYDL